MAVFVIGSRSRVHGLQARRKAAWTGPPPLGANGPDELVRLPGGVPLTATGVAIEIGDVAGNSSSAASHSGF